MHPISPYLFIFRTEVLPRKIREDKDIKVVQILDRELKISQFAHDTSLISEGDSKSYENILEFRENLRMYRG